MKVRKTICITTILFMLLVITIPITMGLTTNKKTNNTEKLEVASKCFGEPDLIVKFEKLEYDRLEFDGTDGYSIYNVKYALKNLGRFYIGWPLIALINPENMVYEYDSWYEPNRFLILRGCTRTLTQEIKIETGLSSNLDEERVFAGRNILIDVISAGRPYDDNPKSNINWAKFWNEDEDYEPTLAHLYASTPYSHQKNLIEINEEEKYYIKSNINEELPDIIKNQRIGWGKNLSVYLIKIGESIEKILLDYDKEFAEDSYIHLEPLINWYSDISEWFELLAEEGIPSNNIITKINELPNILTNNIVKLRDVSENHYSEVVPPVEKLISDVEGMIDCNCVEDWQKPINIKGEIIGLEIDEAVEVRCRGEKISLKDEDDGTNDSKVLFDFMVSSNPISPEKYNFEPHCCVIEIAGDKHEGELESELLTSYCFSGGIIEKKFDLNKSDGEDKGVNIDFISKNNDISIFEFFKTLNIMEEKKC